MADKDFRARSRMRQLVAARRRLRHGAGSQTGGGEQDTVTINAYRMSDLCVRLKSLAQLASTS